MKTKKKYFWVQNDKHNCLMFNILQEQYMDNKKEYKRNLYGNGRKKKLNQNISTIDLDDFS